MDTKDKTTVDVTTVNNRGAVPAQLVGKGFKKGQSGNPKGRPVGSRTKLSEKFLADALAAWSDHGADALVTMAVTEPGKFCTMVAGVLPKDFQVSVQQDQTTWVIASTPIDNALDWATKHGLDTQVIESTAESVEKE